MNNNEKVTQSTAMEYRRRICLSMNFICNNLEKDLSLDEIARSASFSMFHFHRIFKAVVGETVAEFTRRLRLEQAANKLLMNRDSTITDIALDCGFSSSQNFAKAFRNGLACRPRSIEIASRETSSAREKTHYLPTWATLLTVCYLLSKNQPKKEK